MPLTTCPDCKRQVSTEAPACPGCGRPIAAFGTPSHPPYPTSSPQPVVVVASRSRGVYIILGIFFGLLGIHNFYAGYYARGAAQLAITLFLGWLIVGLVITGLWVLGDLFGTTRDAQGYAFV